MLDALQDVILPLQSWLFETLVQPALYQLGLMTWAEPAFNAVEFFVLGLVEMVAIYALVRPLEVANPAERWPDRHGVGTDVLYTLLNRLGVIPLAVFFLLLPVVEAFDGWLRLHDIVPRNLEDFFPVLARSPLLSFVVYLLIFDFAEYVKHRLQHRFDWWWALHSLHHSQQRMTLWTDSRNHLLDDVIGGVWTATIALLIGVPPGQFVLLVLATRLVESLSHANTRLGFGSLGQRLLVGPLFHRTHHAVGTGHEGSHAGCNFGVLLPLWDMLFRTANYQPAYLTTGIRDQLEGRDYGDGFVAQQVKGLQRLALALRAPFAGRAASRT